MYYYIVVLKKLSNFRETHLHGSPFSTCNLQLHWERDAGIYRFLRVLRNTLGTLGISLRRDILCKVHIEEMQFFPAF